MRSVVIATDFDGTLCEDKYPWIGEPNNKVIKYLKQAQKKRKAKIILWTCRTDKLLLEAIEWCSIQGLKFDAVNENIPEIVRLFGSDSRKIFADEYIDDKMCTKFRLPYIQQKQVKGEL